MNHTACSHDLAAFDLLSNPVWVLDRTAERLLWANRAAVRLAGRNSLDALRALEMSEIVVGKPSRPVTVGPDAASGAERQQRWQFTSPTGPRPVDCDCREFALTDGTRAVLVEGRSASDDRAGLVGARQALTEAKRLLGAVLTNTPIGLVIADADHIVRLVNRAFCEIFGCEANDMAEHSLACVFGSPRQFQEVCQRADPLVAAAETFREEISMHRLDGHPVWCSLSARLVDETQPELGVIWVASDITQRVAQQQMLAEARDALERQTAELARSNADLEQFAYVASHDLRQPLRLVSSYVSLLERNYSDQLDDSGRTFIAFARDGVLRMDALIVDLLEYSRLGRRPPPDQVVPLDQPLAEALRDLDISIQESGATVTAEKPLPAVQGDPFELTRLLQNLIGNAIKYHAEDRQPAIRVSAARDGDHCVLSIADNGIGIDPAQFERIFKIFQRLHPRDQYEGTGIGLAICRKIVERMNGQLWVESRPDQGSTFHARLPLAPDGPDSDA